MKHTNQILAYAALLCFMCVSQTFAQGFGDPLTFQGLSHTTTQSVASRALGGISFGFKNDVSLMFSNPASLTTLKGLQVSIGGLQQYTYMKQDQLYGGLQGHSAFSLLTEAATGEISDPDTNLTFNGKKVTLTTQADSVQRPFDAIGPNWNRSKSNSLPVQVFVAAPFTISNIQMVGGLGAVQYANLDWYYQNNNCFSPSVLSVVDSTVSTSGLNANPYLTQWYQYYQQRNGQIYGYGGALSAALNERLSVGISFLLLKGSTDDEEVRVGRGQMQFFTNSLRLTKQGMSSFTKTGTSDYSGTEFSVSAEYRSQYFDCGFAVKLPTTITRKYSMNIWTDSVAATEVYAGRVDSVHVSTTSSVSGQDKIALPLQGRFGFGIRIKENFTIGIDYEIRSYASAEYTSSGGSVSNPWLSSSVLHLGGEYRVAPWLALRGGVYTFSEVFQPITEALRGDPVSYPVYSLGCGLKIVGGTLDVTYEYSDMKYVDTWSNAASINQGITNNVVASFSYTTPW